jgi:DNA-binding Lrp family transcriptional regulator
MTEFTLDELLLALQEAARTDDESSGRTVVELCDALNLSDKTVRKRLRKLAASGKVRHVRVLRTKINGAIALTDGYQWTNE